MSAGDPSAAVRLIERLIGDAAFRADFRRDPDAATRAARIRGVDPRLIAQLRELGPEALQSLDERESRSSLAGVMMAAAVEGVALHDLGQSLAQHLDHPAPAVPAAPATPASYSPSDPPEPPDAAPAAPVAPAPWIPSEPPPGGQVPRGGQVQQMPAIPTPAKAAPAPSPLPTPERRAPPVDSPVARAASGNALAPGGSSDDDDEQPDDSAGDDSQAGDDGQAADDSAGDDGQVAEDGGSGDTEAQADAESDGDDGGDDDEDTDDASDNAEGSQDEDSGSGDDSDDGDDNSDDGDDGSDGDHDSGDGDHDDNSDSDDDGSSDDSSNDSDSNNDDSSNDSEDSGVEVDDYPGDSAPQPQIAAWMATEARKRGLPPELPVMASLVESGLKNNPGGDADSAGYFQMRVGIWNNGAYAGYPNHPEKQLDWFLDHAAAVKKQRLAAGQPVDSKHYGEWIADVERPAAQYRGRYQLRLDDARSLLDHARSGHKSGGSNNAEDVAHFDSGDHSGVQSPKEMLSVATKVDKLHLSYLWGGGHGAEPAPVGGRVDCSGYVSQILGVKPRTSGGFMSFGNAGAGKQVTIYANQEHVFIQIGSRFFSTSHSNPGGGPGEVPRPDAGYLSRFVKRHPAGL